MMPKESQPAKKSFTDKMAHLFFRFIAMNFNTRKSLKRYLKSEGGWLNFTFAIKTENGSVEQSILFKNGRVHVTSGIPEKPDAMLVFVDEKAVKEAAVNPPNKLMMALMENRMHTIGNIGYLQLMNFYLSLVLKHVQISKLKKEASIGKRNFDQEKASEQSLERRKTPQLKAGSQDTGVLFLKDSYLSEYSLDDFPRLKEFLAIHLKTRPSICHERPEILTRWYRENGFEKDKRGAAIVPELRQARGLRYLMENRKPIIRKNDLIAGTTTTKEIGVVLYPDAHGTMIWGELLTTPHRPLNPYDVDPETINILHDKVFPFWVKRNFREWVREKKGYPVCQKLDERFAACFLWKTTALSHTTIDFPKILKLGTTGIISEIEKEMAETNETHELGKQKKDTLLAMKICLEGLVSYVRNLSKEAKRLADSEGNKERRQELTLISDICAKVPENPCTTLDEAVNAMWIIWVGVHMENTNAGFSLGRLDQWLQPYFVSDLEKITNQTEREAYVKHAIELIGCFYCSGG